MVRKAEIKTERTVWNNANRGGEPLDPVWGPWG